MSLTSLNSGSGPAATVPTWGASLCQTRPCDTQHSDGEVAAEAHAAPNPAALTRRGRSRLQELTDTSSLRDRSTATSGTRRFRKLMFRTVWSRMDASSNM